MGAVALTDHSPLYHFTVATKRGWEQDDVATLLRRVATALDELGAVDVHDITFHVDWTDEGSWPSMTVYYELNAAAAGAGSDVIDMRDEHVVAFDTVVSTPPPLAPPIMPPVAPPASSPPAAAAPAPSPWGANVFALDRVADAFIGSAAPHQANGNGNANGNGLSTANGNGHEPVADAVEDEVEDDVEDDDDVLDVVAAEAEERSALDRLVASVPVREGAETAPLTPVIEQIPVVAHGEETLPVGAGAPVVPRAPVVPGTNPFPLRDPAAFDQRALRRLKELWRTTNSRRRPNGRY
jgi:hypothetical protein